MIDPRVGCARSIRRPDLLASQSRQSNPELAIVFGTLIIVFLALKPEGLNRLWRKVLNYFRVWPFSY